MSDLRDAVIQLSLAIEKLAPLSAGERQLEIERHARWARRIAMSVDGVAGIADELPEAP